VSACRAAIKWSVTMGHMISRLAADLGSTDANNAVGMGIPAVAVGAGMDHQPHRLEEFADASKRISPADMVQGPARRLPKPSRAVP
jgi:hypothetical protein